MKIVCGDKWGRLNTGLLLLGILDWIITRFALSTGLAVEINPIMRGLIEQTLGSILKLGAHLGVWVVLGYLLRSTNAAVRRMTRAVLAGLLLVYIFAAVNNTLVVYWALSQR